MPGIENRGSLPRALWPGVKRWVGLEYDRYPLIAEQIFDMQSSDMAFEEDVAANGLSLAQIKSEGGPTPYDSISQGYTYRYTHASYALGFIVTREEFDDNKYRKVAAFRSAALARSFKTSKEIVAHNVLNNAFSGSYNQADGVPLISSSHPTPSGNQSNTGTVSADFSETAVEDMLKVMLQAKDSVGIPIRLRATQLIVSTDSVFDANRLTRSALRVGTANNDTNAVRDMGWLPGEPLYSPYLTDSDAWFLKTDIYAGLTGYNRTPFEIRRENDFDTLNLKVAGFERYSFGCTDWRGIWGNPGA